MRIDTPFARVAAGVDATPPLTLHYPPEPPLGGALTVALAATPDMAEWDAFVARHPGGTLFHELAWRDAVAAAFAHRTVDFVARRGARVCGVLPLVYIRSILGGRRLVSVPYGVYGGPLADDAETYRALDRAAANLACELQAECVEYRAAVDRGQPDGDGWNAIDDYVTFRRELPNNADDVAAWLPRKARAAARRAEERNDLRVTFDDADLDTVWRLYARSMRRLGSINYPRRLFAELIRRTPGRHLVQVVWTHDRPVAGLITFRWRDVAMPYFVGLDERSPVYGLSNHVYYRCMQQAVAWGCRWFDFGRSRQANAGSVNFKRLHGFDPQPLAYRRFVRPGARVRDLSPGASRFRLARRIWPRLPLAITQPLGERLSRYIPG